jgi:hypothetical protein
MNNFAMNTSIQVLCGHTFSFLLGKLPGHIVTIYPFKKLPDYFLTQQHHFTFPPAMYEDSNLFTPCQHISLSVFSITALYASLNIPKTGGFGCRWLQSAV